MRLDYVHRRVRGAGVANPDTYTYCDPDSYCNGDDYSYRNTHSYCNSNTNTHGHTYSYRNGYANTYCDCNADFYAWPRGGVWIQ